MIERILDWDREVFLALNFDGGAGLDRFFWIVSGKLTWVPFYLLIVFLLWRRYGWRRTLLAMILMAVAVVVADQVCNVLKDAIAKLRPTHSPDLEGLIHLVKRPEGSYYRGYMYGSVSAHAATTFTVAAASSLLIRSRIFTAGAIIWALLICYSRIYIGAHYPLDLIGGAVFGTGLGVLSVWLFSLTTGGRRPSSGKPSSGRSASGKPESGAGRRKKRGTIDRSPFFCAINFKTTSYICGLK